MMKTCLLVACLLSTLCHALPTEPSDTQLTTRDKDPFGHLSDHVTNALARRQANADIPSSGNYKIFRCGEGRRSKTAALQKTLPKVYEMLQAAIADLPNGIQSQYGFKALFKTDDAKERVRTVYETIMRGDNVYPEGKAAQPTIVCLSPNDDTFGFLYDSQCKGHKIPAKQAIGTEFVMLCPQFWTYVQTKTGEACPKLTNNLFSPNDIALVESRASILFHELVHLYGVNVAPGAKEIFGFQNIINLDAAASANNAGNYEVYVDSVYAQCTDWPQ